MNVTEALLGPLLRTDPAAPRITHYDDSVGSRIELSGATLANWAAKTANWLRDDLAVQPGDPVAVLLPPHWQTAGLLLGAWWCGAVTRTDPSGAAVAFCGVDRVAEARAADEIAVVGLDALGVGVADPPAGAMDYVGEARVHGDTFTAAPTGVPGAAEWVAAATELAGRLGLTDADRLVCTVDWDTAGDGAPQHEPEPGRLFGAVLAAGCSLVQCTDTDPAVLPKRCTDERATVTLGVTVAGLRRLAPS